MPTVHDLNKSRNRPFAAAFLALWIERESASKYRLLHLFAKEHEVFTFEDHDIMSFADGATEAASSLAVVRRRLTANLSSSNLGGRDVVLHDTYRLTADEISTLKPIRIPCSSVINAFLSLLEDKYNFILTTYFCYHLTQKNTGLMLSWPMDLEKLRHARLIIIPLHSKSSYHFGLAVVNCFNNFIDTYDSLPDSQLFLPLYPKIVRWANSLRSLFTEKSVQWSSSYRIRERKNVSGVQDFGVDAAIFMLAHAYNVTQFNEDEGMYPRNICKIRAEIRDCLIVKVTCVFLSTATQKMPSSASNGTSAPVRANPQVSTASVNPHNGNTSASAPLAINEKTRNPTSANSSTNTFSSAPDNGA